MNYVLGTIGGNLTLGLLSTVTATTNSVYTLMTNLTESTATGANEVRSIIKETNLEAKMKTAQFMLCEMVITNTTPQTILFCIEQIKDAINDIAQELSNIRYRLQYNKNKYWRVGAYRFHNSRKRLENCLAKLASSVSAFIEILPIENRLSKNKELNIYSRCSSSTLLKEITPQTAEQINENLHRDLQYINAE